MINHYNSDLDVSVSMVEKRSIRLKQMHKCMLALSGQMGFTTVMMYIMTYFKFLEPFIFPGSIIPSFLLLMLAIFICVICLYAINIPVERIESFYTRIFVLVSFSCSLAYLGAFANYETEYPYICLLFISFVLINLALGVFQYFIGWETFGIIVVGFSIVLASFIWFFLEGRTATFMYILVFVLQCTYFYATYNFTNEYVLGNHSLYIEDYLTSPIVVYWKITPKAPDED